MQRIIIALILMMSVIDTDGQHIQYRDKKKPVAVKSGPTDQATAVPVPDRTIVTAPVPKPIELPKDTSASLIKTKAAFTLNPRPRKPWVEDQNLCNLVSRPELAPQLPLVINNVKPEMVTLLKQRYKGRLYSITGLNMIDERLKFKLKICDKDNAKFRSEYLDKDGNVVKDPGLYYD